MKMPFIVMACITILIVLVTTQSAAAQGKLQGVWKITEVTRAGLDALAITNPQPNLFIFTKKHFSLMGVTGDKPRPDLPQKDATDAQKVATWTPFTANAGTYEVKGTTIAIHPIVGKNPIEPGSFTTFDFKIKGDTLSLTTKANKAGPIANPLSLRLTRVE